MYGLLQPGEMCGSVAASQPLSPEWNQLTPRRATVDSAERPMNTSTANQHWHSHSLSTPLSVAPYLRFDGHLIELQICLEERSRLLEKQPF